MSQGVYLLIAHTRAGSTFTAQDIAGWDRAFGKSGARVAAWPGGMILATATADSAQETVERIKGLLGNQVRVSVLELGPDQAHWTPFQHNADDVGQLEALVQRARSTPRRGT